MKKGISKLLVLLIILTFLSSLSVFATPSNTTITAGTPETFDGTASTETASAQGGNVTALQITTSQQTSNWQGFYGNVSGIIMLANTAGNSMYNWSVTTVSGEVYATTNASVDFSTAAVQTNCTKDEDITGTGTDRVNITFTTGNTPGFSVGATSIANTCRTATYNSTGGAPYPEALLTDGSGATTLYAGIINQTTGFNGQTTDFQMMVPANSTVQTYNFFLELN